MTDTRSLVRWLDLSWFAPMPLSLGLAVWSITARPDPSILASLLLAQMALMACAAGVPAAIAARHSKVWQRRIAPGSFASAVHRKWREQTSALLLLGLVGPAAVAVRALDMGALSLAGWALALPVLGTALGALAAWGWAGSLMPAALALWPGLAGAAVLLWLDRSAWITAAWPAGVCLVGGLLLLVVAFQASCHLQPRWTGVQPLLERWTSRKTKAMRRRSWVPLAYDDGNAEGRASAWHWLSNHGLFIFMVLTAGTPARGLTASVISGWASLSFLFYLFWVSAMASSGLMLREAHWRLRLAPSGPSQRIRVSWMLAGSTTALAGLMLALVGLRAWLDGLALAEALLPAALVAADAALCIAFAACVRGFSNRRAVMTLALFGLSLTLGAALWALHMGGYVLHRGLAFLVLEASLALALTGLAVRLWRHRVMRGCSQPPA